MTGCCFGTGKSGLVSGCGCCWTGNPGSVYELIWQAGVCTVTVGGSFLSLSPRFSWTGVNLRGHFLLRSVIILLPSILTLYCLFGNTSNTTPLLVHLKGLLPAWFCTTTLSPSSRGVCSLTWASSLHSATSCHVLDKSLLLPSSGMRRVEREEVF